MGILEENMEGKKLNISVLTGMGYHPGKAAEFIQQFVESLGIEATLDKEQFYFQGPEKARVMFRLEYGGALKLMVGEGKKGEKVDIHYSRFFNGAPFDTSRFKEYLTGLDGHHKYLYHEEFYNGNKQVGFSLTTWVPFELGAGELAKQISQIDKYANGALNQTSAGQSKDSKPKTQIRASNALPLKITSQKP